MKETNKLMISKRNELNGICCQFLIRVAIRKQKIAKTIATVITFRNIFMLTSICV